MVLRDAPSADLIRELRRRGLLKGIRASKLVPASRLLEKPDRAGYERQIDRTVAGIHYAALDRAIIREKLIRTEHGADVEYRNTITVLLPRRAAREAMMSEPHAPIDWFKVAEKPPPDDGRSLLLWFSLPTPADRGAGVIEVGDAEYAAEGATHWAYLPLGPDGKIHDGSELGPALDDPVGAEGWRHTDKCRWGPRVDDSPTIEFLWVNERTGETEWRQMKGSDPNPPWGPPPVGLDVPDGDDTREGRA